VLATASSLSGLNGLDAFLTSVVLKQSSPRKVILTYCFVYLRHRTAHGVSTGTVDRHTKSKEKMPIACGLNYLEIFANCTYFVIYSSLFTIMVEIRDMKENGVALEA